MKITYKIVTIILFIAICLHGCVRPVEFCRTIDNRLIHSSQNTVICDSIIYHPVRLDGEGAILPWFSPDLGQSYDTIIKLVWNFWDNMEIDSNGVKYYMNHQVWRPEHDKRGLGGDQVNMALSSWDLLYNYTGNPVIIENMRYMADYYIAHSLSESTFAWPNIPYPYNCDLYSGEYDGDMVIGKGYTQPDKAGSLGWELIKLYKKTGEQKYLNVAIKIADTLAEKVQVGDNDCSPWPFKVHAGTGGLGHYKSGDKLLPSTYTTNYTGTIEMFNALIALGIGDTAIYRKSVDLTLDWLKKYPAKTNKWGPFFEDIPVWSDTQINAITYAMFLMEHPVYDTNWEQTVKGIFEWVHKELGNNEFQKYGVFCTNEQTVYRVPGNSHSSRQASIELLYWSLTGDTTYLSNAIRELSWATYMVDWDGKNLYPRDDIWLTDGYGDYIRHYIRAMAAAPQLAPANSDHLLKTSSIVKEISYKPYIIGYKIFDSSSEEIFRLTSKPKEVKVNGIGLKRIFDVSAEGWSWQPLDKGGILKIKQAGGNKIEIIK